jgi:hypothetical protein
MTDRRSNAAPIAIAAILLLLPCLYVGSYAALVRRVSLEYDRRTPGRIALREDYRVGRSVAKHFYAPANWADRRIRRDYWIYQGLY